MEQYLKFTYEDGSAEIILDAFFPAPLRQLDRLLKLTEENSDPEGVRKQMQDFCREKREDLQKKLPELRALARGSGISARAAAQVLKKTAEEIQKRREERKKLIGPAERTKAVPYEAIAKRYTLTITKEIAPRTTPLSKATLTSLKIVTNCFLKVLSSLLPRERTVTARD